MRLVNFQRHANLEKTQDLNIPNPCPLSPNESENMPYVLVGDDAFALSENLHHLFGSHNLSITKFNFNYGLCRAHRYVECACL